MPRPHGNCKFRNEWLAIHKLKDWVARDRTDDQVAKCTLCMKTVRIANAGKHALESHLRSAQHQRCERAASTSMVNVLAPQRRVAVPVLTVDIPSTSTSGDSRCETGTFSTGKFAKSTTGEYSSDQSILSNFLT